MQELYDRIKEAEDEKTIEVSLSYLEVYNETIRDLLSKPGSESSKPASLHLREDSAKKISIAGLSEHHPKGVISLCKRPGVKKRKELHAVCLHLNVIANIFFFFLHFIYC